MARRVSETARLERDLGKLIEAIELTDIEKQFMRGRWLDQVLWMETAATRARQTYYGLRLVTVIGAVVVPGLVSLDETGGSKTVVKWLAFAISLIVASSAAVEGFFQFGTRWRHYREQVEHLKSEGWSFAELGGAYRRSNVTHAAAFPTFVARVERTLGQEVDEYVAQVAPQAGKPARQDE
jgi:uncharacterized protein DUF4231